MGDDAVTDDHAHEWRLVERIDIPGGWVDVSRCEACGELRNEFASRPITDNR